MERALICGVTGQDGHYLAEHLLELGYEVFGMVRHTSSPATVPEGVIPVYGDVTDSSSVCAAMDSCMPYEVYNLAAMSHVGKSFKSPALTHATNAIGAKTVFREAQRHGAKIYQASTSEMFGNAPAPQNEHTPFNPVSPYAVAKLEAHRAALEAGGYCGILFNHESPLRGAEFVTQKIVRGVADIHYGRAESIVLGNIEAKRDWGHAKDYVRAMHMMMQHEPGEYVVATGETRSIKEFLTAAFKFIGVDDWKPYIDISPEFYRPNEVNELCGDATKMRNIGWEPEISFDGLVSDMMGALV